MYLVSGVVSCHGAGTDVSGDVRLPCAACANLGRVRCEEGALSRI